MARETVRKGNAEEFTERTNETSDSVELKMSAKGDRYWDIKLYFLPGMEAEALARLNMIDVGLQQIYGEKEEKA